MTDHFVFGTIHLRRDLLRQSRGRTCSRRILTIAFDGSRVELVYEAHHTAKRTLTNSAREFYQVAKVKRRIG